MSNNQFDWVDFYAEFANKLLDFKSDRKELIKKVKAIFENSGINMPRLDRPNLIDIDPFTVFGLFNKSSMKHSNRTKIITQVAKLFDIKAPIPKSFDSIPVLNNMNATYYRFQGDREEDDIDHMWDLYEAALDYSKNQTGNNVERLSKYFDIVIAKKGVGNSKITMALYWIAPELFLNLDKRNKWYIYDSGKLPSELVKELPPVQQKLIAADYLTISEKLNNYLRSEESPLKNFNELSFEAWRYSKEVNKAKSEVEPPSKVNPKGVAVADEDIETTRYWIYSPGPGSVKWREFHNEGIMAIRWDEIGDLSEFSGKDEMINEMKEKIDSTKSFTNAAHATWQFANEMKPGDIVFVKKGMSLIIGRGVVESTYMYDSARDEYKNIRKVKWTHEGEWAHPGRAVMKTLTDITPYREYVEKLNDLFDSNNIDDIDEEVVNYPPYNAEKFLEEVFMDKASYETLVALVKNKLNVILLGAPGVGKTYAAKRLAYSIMGEKDPTRVMMVQFHQSYSYEDFIMGFRPSEAGFELKRGAFYNFCKEAEVDSENDYFFIIDEINRGNLSKIFGELFMLVENDKRGVELQLLYSDEKFSVPDNIHIIGMMNTADRSLAMLDFALRRRFAFFEMKPGFDSAGFREYRTNLNNPKFDNVIRCISDLNMAIAEDESLGDGFKIGHSYFCNLSEVTDHALHRIVEFELIPLLKEYWFDESGKVKEWTERLRRAIQ